MSGSGRRELQKINKIEIIAPYGYVLDNGFIFQ